MSDHRYELRPVGWVESVLTDRRSAPKQGEEGAPQAVVVFEASVGEAVRDLRVGAEAILLTWLDRADREVLTVHPRGNPDNPEVGVFSSRSPDRPNPIGLHRIEITAIEGLRFRVRNLEALNGTPVLDVKPLIDRGSWGC